MTVIWQPALAALQAAISGIPLIFLTNGGNGYDAPPNVTIDPPPPGGVQATALANMGIGSVNVFAGGFGYKSVPNVVFLSGAGGTGAAATAVLTPFTVQGVKVTSPGSGYTSAPTVQFSGGGGTGATGNAVLSGGVVTAVHLRDGGSGYTSAPTVSLSGGGGIGAIVTCTMGNTLGNVTTVTLTAGGGNYSSPPTVAGTGGTGLVIDVTINGILNSITTNDVAVVGTDTPAGYTPGSVVSVAIDPPDLPGGVQATATAVAPASPTILGPVAVTITNAGSGYSYPPGVFLGEPDVPGSGAVDAVATVDILGPVGRPDALNPLVVSNAGTGYSSGSLTFSGGGGSGASGTYTVADNTVTALQLFSGGTGYTSSPVVTFVGGTPMTIAQATASATPIGVASVQITGPGSGYSSVPTVIFIGGGGNGADGTVVMNPTTVASIVVTNPGTGYTSPPLVAIEGGSGIGAKSTSALRVVSFDVTNGGFGYTGRPFPNVTITASDGVGGGATAAAGLALALVSGDLLSLVEAQAIATELAGIGASYDAGIPIPVSQRAARYVAPPPVNFFEVDKATRFAAGVSSWFSWPASWEMEPTGKTNVVMMRANTFNDALQVHVGGGGAVDPFIGSTWQPLFNAAVPWYAFVVVSQREATAATTSPYPDNHPLAVQLAALVATATELATYLNTP